MFHTVSRNGLGMSTGIDFEALAETGEYICKILRKSSQSKAARAFLSKRDGS